MTDTVLRDSGNGKRVTPSRERQAGPAAGGPEGPDNDERVASRREQRAEPLYIGRIKVYPRKVRGTMRRLKTAMLLLLLAVYYAAPWLRWDRGPGAPDQALLIDLPGRRGYFLWVEIWPQEVYYLTGILVLAALGLFLATSLFGRVWCGFTCPQTVWTDLFMWVERAIEGDRNARMRLDKQPLSVDKAARKIAKHGAWLVIALLTGGAWAMYFTDAPTLVREFFTGQASLTVYFFVGLFTFTTYLLAGWAREQVCTYMCPWPRIQGAMLDEDSLNVTYRTWRGEPRGKHKAGTSWEGHGDCVDCFSCVAVCPTGIDIRDGAQLECIGCGLCIDACNEVMTKVGRPQGLIAFDSARNLALQSAGQPRVPWKPIRLRTIVYVALLLLVAAGVVAALGTRSTLDINVLPERTPLFVLLKDGSIQNAYTLKILNKQRLAREFTLTVASPANARIEIVGAEPDGTLAAKPDHVATYRVLVSLPRAEVKDERQDLTFVLTDKAGDDSARHRTVFRGPHS
ncbi:MAG TPA: cytochrome c oxidase accessory protein CcoG [Hypericibacter adhaerens]|jgi:cytochrome c oxidase accessory protein FixG|uniref:Ferredoxin n=1 Tax=Hypericibacter adhaerens TaxID=2602016 RepID=A0A5J6MU72_9PROT|nr:cytochrome c oxidase accessory protein CcoG [Hypericibacter adhaerens]QEX20763.1 ferredoxin [Hypericibacter adhaerens]HWA42197.1 cytochrome c oxidase accessory protein CcoG [Hypericibacter adhaerens]